MEAQANYQASQAPVGQLKTNRGLLKLILLSIITLGIYSIVYFASISNDINIMASRYDGRKTMNYLWLFFLVGFITFGIAYFVWFHNISNRIGSEINRRRVDYKFGASTYWLWSILGSLIIIGPFVYLHKLSVAMNKLSRHYNRNG